MLRELEGDDGRAARIAAAGQRFALSDLSAHGLDCYWYRTLRHYLRLYFA